MISSENQGHPGTDTNRITIELLRIINEATSRSGLIHSVTVVLKEWLHCDAIGIRLSEGEDFPYYETTGFPETFVRAERRLCSYDSQGRLRRDGMGNPVLDCMCGNILCRRVDPSKPFFTGHGSFWSNSTTELLASTSEEDRMARTRNRCNGEGYESVGLFPLHLGNETFGLLQVNHKRPGLFDANIIASLELFADNLAIRLAQFRSDEALRASEERYRLIFENSGDGILFTDPEGNVYSANPEACRILGRSEEEIRRVGRNGIIDPSDPRLPGALAERTRTGHFRGELNFIRADGTLFPAEISTSAFSDPHGNQRTSIIIRDVTESKRVEEMIHKSEEKFSKAFKASPESIAIASMEDARYVDVNDTFLRVFGFTRDEVIGHTAIELNVWADLADRARYIDELSKHERVRNFEARFRTHSGEVGLFLVSSEVIVLDGKKCSLNFVLDITERKRAEENLFKIEQRLRQSEKMEAVGQLAGGIAHDFNNVLSGIIGFTDLSLGLAEKNSVLERNLLNVLKAADRAKHLVQQILAFSRRSNPLRSPGAIRPIVTEVLDLIRSSIPSSVIINAELEDGMKPVLIDSTQLHQAILNLVTNAVQAMQRKGTLTLRLSTRRLGQGVHGRSGDIAPGEYAVIEVGDTGCGMDAQTMAKVFEPFFTTKPVGEGTGMGLSVVLGIVQSHGGDVQLESVVGEGTIVRIFLPVIEASVQDASSSAAAEDRLAGEERILFVDDEQMLVDMAENLLQPLGYTVVGMTNSVDALEYLKGHGHEIDLLITDQTMPRMTGIEFVTEVRQFGRRLPVIVCTGFSAEITPERVSALEIDRLVMKPYGTRELCAAIREVMDEKSNE